MKITDKNYIKEISLGNEKALEYVMTKYGDLVKSIVHKYLYCLSQYEEECINDVFGAVWCHISSYKPDANSFANWIGGIARLKALDYKRKYVRQLVETSLDEIEYELGKSDYELLNCFEHEFSEELEQMMKCLKKKDQELLYRLYVEEHSMDEVSHSMKMTKPQIYNRISRAKRKIRDSIKNIPFNN